MPDTPYGVTGCRCWLTGHSPGSDDGDVWNDNPHCPYHGLLPRDRTDTGVYRVVRGDDGKPTELKPIHDRDGEPVIPPSDTEYMVGGRRLTDLDERLRRGIEQAQRGETGTYRIDVPMTPRELNDALMHTCDHPDCTGPDTDHHTVAVMTIKGCVMNCVARGCPMATRLPDGTPADIDGDDHADRVADAAERVARVSEGLNQRLAGCTCGDGSTDRQRSCPRHGYDGDVWDEGPEQLHAAVDGGMGGRIACACGNVWPCPVAKGPRCKGRGYCVYHDTPTVHDTGPLVAQPLRRREVTEEDRRQALDRLARRAEAGQFDALLEEHQRHADADTDPDAVREYLASRTWDTPFFEGSAPSAKHLASGALRPALTAEEEKYYWLIHKPAWWRRLFRR